tara:strand:- start:268 stop:564 length:297 start_codon:yes stop_codon:yes gene_type:complete
MASKSKGRGKSMKMCSSTQLLMLVATLAVLYIMFKGGGGGLFSGHHVATTNTYCTDFCDQHCLEGKLGDYETCQNDCRQTRCNIHGRDPYDRDFPQFP